MKMYTNTELDTICTDFITHLYTNYGESDIYWFFKLLYCTGARYSDVVNFFDWQTTNTAFLYIGIKNKRPAVVPFGLADFDILNFYNNYNSILNLKIGYSVLLGYWYAWAPTMTVGGAKQLGLHTFRHNLAKKLYDNGLVIDDICNIVGDGKVTCFNKYVNSVIYSL
jgi:site-specific recombinase XerD